MSVTDKDHQQTQPSRKSGAYRDVFKTLFQCLFKENQIILSLKPNVVRIITYDYVLEGLQFISIRVYFRRNTS